MPHDVRGGRSYKGASSMSSVIRGKLGRGLRGLRLFTPIRPLNRPVHRMRVSASQESHKPPSAQGTLNTRGRLPTSYQRESQSSGITRPTVELSEEQEIIANFVVENNESVFFTGSAGSGKSVLLREIIYRLTCKYSKEEVAITASTGISAFQIRGITLHSFAGVKLGRDPLDVLLSKIRGEKRLLDRWKNTKILVIDEISMVEGDFFDKLENLARLIRGNEIPFGGIKVVLCGDFMQLPPVSKESKFVFESRCWSALITRIFVLDRIFRQNESEFKEMLSEIRNGMISIKSDALLRSLSRPIEHNSNPQAATTVRIFPLRSQVNACNEEILARLSGPLHVFRAVDTAEPGFSDILSSLAVPDLLKLKSNASVMLIKNLTDVLVNGTIGRVTGFDPDEGYPYVAFTVDSKPCIVNISPEVWKMETHDGRVIATRTQVPLILAYCMSIHKAQGLTFHRVSVDMGNIFESGQAYVALSRASSLSGLQVLNYHPSKVRINPKIVEFYKKLQELKTNVQEIRP